MLAAYTKLEHAQQLKQKLLAKKVLHQEYLPVKELGLIYFPLTKKVTGISPAKITTTKFTFPQKPKPKRVEDFLKGKLTPKELTLLPRSQELVGKIMILEVPKELQSKETLIAQAYLKLNPQIETVVKKTAMHSGVFRTRKVKILAGKKSKETMHFENGIKLLLHLERTYYSARSANERLRVAKQVKKDENILVMFSGAGPYPLVLAKNTPAKKIIGIEINPLAHRYAIDSVALNKLEHKIILQEGDVRQILPKIRKKFHRIAMPLPKLSEEFLDVALPKVLPNGIIHLYAFLDEKEIVPHAKEIKASCNKLKYDVKVLRSVKCGQFSPGTFRVCYDLKVIGKVSRNKK